MDEAARVSWVFPVSLTKERGISPSVQAVWCLSCCCSWRRGWGLYVCGGLCSVSEALGTPPVSGPLGHCRHLGEQDKHGSYPWEVYILLGVKSGEVADNY